MLIAMMALSLLLFIAVMCLIFISTLSLTFSKHKQFRAE